MIEWIQAVIKEIAYKYDVSSWAMERTLSCESGGFKLSVIQGHVLGRAGEKGIAQLHPYGLEPLFYKLGYDTPFSVWQSVDFMGWAFAHGLAHHWSCYNLLMAGLIR